MISGFIMVYTSFGNTTRKFLSSEFLLRRFIRIYPIYWIYSALYIAFPIVSAGYSLSVWNLLRSLLLLPDYSSLIIGQGWTLSYEIYFYICFGAFMRLGLFRGLLVMTLFFLFCVAVGWEFISSAEYSGLLPILYSRNFWLVPGSHTFLFQGPASARPHQMRSFYSHLAFLWVGSYSGIIAYRRF